MLLGDNKKQIKLFILNDKQQWQEYVKATLYLDIIQNSCCLRLVLKQPLLPAQLALLPQKNLFNPIDSTIHIEMDRISKLQRMGPLVFALQIEEQKRIFALSFRDALYSDIIFQQLELNEGSTSKLPCKEDELIEYIAGQVATNPGFVEMFFNCDQVIEAFMKQAKQYENQPDNKHKRVVFKTIKQLFLRTDRKIIKLLLKDNRYRQLLLCLSYNYQFGDRTIPYHQQYQKTIAVTNLLQISDNNILQKYHDNIKIRFLIHVATSMFIQPFIESVLLQMIDFNSIDILQFLVKNPENLIKANKLAQTDPCSYLLLFSQLWQMFRFISQDARSIPLKRAFKDLFISQNMLNLAFQSALAVTKNSNSNNRIYQQFLQALNPCLSHKWNQSQQLLLFLYEQKKVHLLQVLINILKVADYNTKVIVMLFAKNLIEITQNRPKMKQNFYNYYFNQFVTLCIPYFQTIEQLQILVDYLMKLYNFDLFRTRRAMIESQLLPQLQNKMHNKYVLILVLKLFRYFVSFSNDGIFGYLKKHKLFEGLRQKYYQTKKYNPNGVVNSLFVGLLRDLQKTENSFGLRYLYQVLCHPNNNK